MPGWPKCWLPLNSKRHGPESVCHWKIVTFPKQRKGVLPTLEELRPIAIGFAIYPLWGRIRLRHLAATLAQDCIQAGGGEDASSLLLPMGVGLDSASYPRLMVLDFADAFGHARAVFKLLSAQWSNQRRWMTFAGTCAKFHGGLLSANQGDPFSAIAMSLVVMLAKRQRTWERFVKLQAANMSPATIAEVLGVSVGIMPTAPTSAEKSIVRSAKKLPKEPMFCESLKKFRSLLATLTLAPKPAWGSLLNGRDLTQAELKDHADDFRLGAKGRFLKGSASRNLKGSASCC